MLEHVEGDFYQLKKFGCINKNHVSLVSGQESRSGSSYNILIEGTRFKYVSVEEYTAEELAREILRIIKVLGSNHETRKSHY